MEEASRDQGRGGCRFYNTAKRRWPVLTIDIETVLVQGVGAQPGDTVGQLTQLPVQPLSVQLRTHGVRAVGADGIHSCRFPIFLRPGEGQ